MMKKGEKVFFFLCSGKKCLSTSFLVPLRNGEVSQSFLRRKKKQEGTESPQRTATNVTVLMRKQITF